jgi:hypothetical protein
MSHAEAEAVFHAYCFGAGVPQDKIIEALSVMYPYEAAFDAYVPRQEQEKASTPPSSEGRNGK